MAHQNYQRYRPFFLVNAPRTKARYANRKIRFSAIPSDYIVICHGVLDTGARLNALLGGSVLHPEEGGYALAVLASPTLVSALFVSGSVSVWLYSVLVDAQVACLSLIHI